MPIISVIVPVYNVEPYIHRCVDSILAQTFTDFELILVDDGSPDNCGAICDEYAAQDERVRVIHQPNGGLSAARNAGIDWAFANSDSEWLSFIDSDDWVHPQFLEALYTEAKKNSVPISMCPYYRISKVETADHSLKSFASVLENSEDVYTANGIAIHAHACNKLFLKDLWRDVRFPVGRIFEDLAVMHKILLSVPKVAVIDNALYYYFINANSIVLKEWTPQKLDYFWVIEGLLNDEIILQYDTIVSLLKKDYFYGLANQLSNISDEYRKYRLLLRKKLRQALHKHKKEFDVSFHKDAWVYEMAYPHLMHCYWLYKGVLGKIKRILKCQP